MIASTTTVSFGTEQFNRIFPFYILVNDLGEIISTGKSLAKLHSVKDRELFTGAFYVKLPKVAISDFNSLKNLSGQAVVLSLVEAENENLRGQFEYLSDQNQLLFVGTPSVHSFDDINTMNLSVTDFARHDPLIDRLLATNIITEQQKQLEHQLKINEKRYRDLFNYSQAFIFTHDLEGKFLSVNPAICEKLGYTAEELVGRMIVDFIPKNDVPNFHSSYLNTVNEEGSAKGIIRVNGKTDKKSFLLYQNFKVEEENMEPYIIGFSQDITDLIKAEKELRKNKRSVEESARAKEFFLANMSHEIRTPLSGILGITNLLSKTTLNEQQRKYTNLITTSANSLLSIVNDILDIEKISSGKFELEQIPFKLEEKVLNTVQAFQYKAEEKNITLSVKCNIAHDLIVIGDPSRLGQVLNNLLNNALKFTNSGGIYLNVYYFTNSANSTVLEFEVSDTGIGIKPERLSDIFSPFVQASSDTSRKFGGTGLGLSICKELIEMHGGKISVKSVLNSGTTFTFYLPYKKGDGSMLVNETSSELDFKILSGLNILVAEDWELNQFLVQFILESWGCKVTMANNGKEALAKLMAADFDLILRDIHMPEMDGIAATKKIRTMKDKHKSAIPVVALTANALKRDHLHYLDVGMNDCVTKPYTEGKLFHVISKLVGRKSDSDELVTAGILQEADADFIEQSSLLYDLSFINEFAKGDTSFIKKMINVFMTAMIAEIKQLQTAEAGVQYFEMTRIAHKMKSAIDGLGITALKQTIRDIEAIKADDVDAVNVKEMVEEVKTVSEEVFAQLEAFLKL